jgi:hypothetical protein
LGTIVRSSSIKHTLPRDVRRDLRQLLKALQSAPAEIKALGQPTAGFDDGAALEKLSNWLYAAWYTALKCAEETQSLVPGRDNLASALRASIAASTRWETGWVAMRTTPSGICLAGRGNQTRELHPGEYVNMARHGLPVAPGDHIAVTELLEWIDEPTGFWCARSWIDEPQKPLVRVYFSVRADQIGFVLMEATETLDSMKLPYSLKCPAFAWAYSRVDSLIVYLEAGSWPRAVAEITAMARRARNHLRNATPPLTKKITQGVAFAEDSGTGESFGENRCRALAPGVLALLQGQWSSLDDRLDNLIETLRAAGIDPARPWLDVVHYEQR